MWSALETLEEILTKANEFMQQCDLRCAATILGHLVTAGLKLGGQLHGVLKMAVHRRVALIHTASKSPLAM